MKLLCDNLQHLDGRFTFVTYLNLNQFSTLKALWTQRVVYAAFITFECLVEHQVFGLSICSLSVSLFSLILWLIMAENVVSLSFTVRPSTKHQQKVVDPTFCFFLLAHKDSNTIITGFRSGKGKSLMLIHVLVFVQYLRMMDVCVLGQRVVAGTVAVTIPHVSMCHFH